MTDAKEFVIHSRPAPPICQLIRFLFWFRITDVGICNRHDGISLGGIYLYRLIYRHISMDLTGHHRKKKPRKPCWLSRFWSLLDFFKLPNGGGGGSRTRVRKCSPPVSTCLVPSLKIRLRYAVETKRI